MGIDLEAQIVITGLGVISSVGIGWKAFWQSLLEGRSGINEVSSFDTSNFSSSRGGEIKNFRPDDFINPEKIHEIGRATQFAIAAAKLALKDAGLGSTDIEPHRSSICVGTTTAEAQVLEAIDRIWVEKGPQHIPGQLVAQYPANTIGLRLAEALQYYGRNVVITTACAAGNYAIGCAFDLLQSRKADIVIAGGTDALSRTAWVGFNRLSAIAPNRCQPFDRNRMGMMVGEGAGMLVLERYEDARKRKAPMYAQVLGYGLACDAHHMTIPDVDGLSRVMRTALNSACIEPETVSYISAHGTGTPANDRVESAAIHKVFGKSAARIPTSSIKSMLGHSMGAASALEAISCALAIRFNCVPPTINFENPDPECNIDCVPNHSRSMVVNIALNNSFAFGGNNACVALGKVH